MVHENMTLVVFRFAGSQARFRMLKHDPVPVNPDIFELSEKSKVHELTDGVENVKYEVKFIFVSELVQFKIEIILGHCGCT